MKGLICRKVEPQQECCWSDRTAGEPTTIEQMITSRVASMAKQLFIALFILLMPCAVLAQGDDASAYYNRANAHYDSGDHDRAIAEYTKAIGLDPKHVIAYHNRGYSYRAKRDLDRAIADYSKAISLDYNSALADHHRGNTYRFKGDLDRAIADITKAIELDAKNFGYARSLGLARFNRGDFKGVSIDLQRSLELRGDDAYAMLFRHLAKARAGEAELEANAGRLKTKEWPYAVIEASDRRPPRSMPRCNRAVVARRSSTSASGTS
jgi:tetratricopeptide (TPR) repeat protein